MLTTRVPSTVCLEVFSSLFSHPPQAFSLYFPQQVIKSTPVPTQHVSEILSCQPTSRKTRSGHLNVNASKKPKCSLKCLLGPPELSTLSRHFHAVPCPNLSRHFHAVPCPAQEFETSTIDLVLTLGFHLCFKPHHQPFNLCPELLMS